MKLAHSACCWGLVVLALASSACLRSPDAKSASYIEAGKILLRDNDPERAILQFRSAIQAKPTNAEAYYQLSLASLATGDLQTAVVAIRKTLELDPKHLGAQLRLAQFMSSTQEPDMLKDAQRRLRALLQDAPENAYALHALAFTELELGRPEDAMQHLEQATAAAPQEVLIAVTLAQAKLRQGDPVGAEETLKKACANSPKSADALVILGSFYASRNRLAEAEQQFQRALSMDANYAAALLNLGTVQRSMGRKQEAEQNFKRLSGLPGRAFRSVYANFLFQEGRRDEAIREFEKQAKDDPEDRQIRTQLVSAYRAVNRVPDAQKVLDQALKKNPKDLDALLQRSEMFIASGKLNDAEIGLNQVLRLQPDSAKVQYILAKLHKSRGDEFTYRQDLYKVLQLDSFLLAVRLELAQALIASKDAKTALNLMDETPNAQKQSPAVLVQRNWALWALGDWAEMRKGIDSGLSAGQNSDLLLQDGMWKLHARNFPDAQTALEKALNIDPGDVRALEALDQAYVAQKQNSTALQKVKEYASHQPKSAPVQEFLGLLLMANGETQQARTALEAASAADTTFVKADLSLAQADVAEGKLDSAQQRLVNVLTKDRTNTIAQLWLGNIEVTKGNYKNAIKRFQQVVTDAPSNAQGLNNLAYALAELGNEPAQALQYAQKAKELEPDNAEYSDTLGWVFFRKGLYPSAVAELERAASKEGNVVWKYHLSMAYTKEGNFSRAREVLQAALKRDPNPPEAKAAKEMLETVLNRSRSSQ